MLLRKASGESWFSSHGIASGTFLRKASEENPPAGIFRVKRDEDDKRGRRHVVNLLMAV